MAIFIIEVLLVFIFIYYAYCYIHDFISGMIECFDREKQIKELERFTHDLLAYYKKGSTDSWIPDSLKKPSIFKLEAIHKMEHKYLRLKERFKSDVKTRLQAAEIWKNYCLNIRVAQEGYALRNIVQGISNTPEEDAGIEESRACVDEMENRFDELLGSRTLEKIRKEQINMRQKIKYLENKVYQLQKT
jgi:hypothetical protein